MNDTNDEIRNLNGKSKQGFFINKAGVFELLEVYKKDNKEKLIKFFSTDFTIESERVKASEESQMELDPIKIAEDKKSAILDNITKAFEHKKFIRNYAMELNKEQIIADLYFKSKNLVVQY